MGVARIIRRNKMKKRWKEIRDGDAVIKTCLQNLSSTQKYCEPKCNVRKSLLARCLSFFLLEPFSTLFDFAVCKGRPT